MTLICDTTTVPVAERSELWKSVISDYFVPLECEPEVGVAVDGRLRAGSVGPVQLSGLEVTTPHTVRRTRQLAADTPGDQYKLSLMLGGQALIVQDSHETVLKPGDFAIYDCSRPYTLAVDDQMLMVACLVPRDIISISPERLSSITATRIAGDSGIAWAVAPFLRRLTDLAIHDEALSDEHRVVESLVDLVESMCMGILGNSAGLPVHSRTEILLRIRAYIDAHLGDELTPAQIADAHHISTRYLHKIFEAEGVSVSRWIRERRLERCRRDLADPLRRDETVTRIGARWGIHRAAHFSRLFRDAYGLSPSEYRMAHGSA